jgi:hypothetical protein
MMILEKGFIGEEQVQPATSIASHRPGFLQDAGAPFIK